MKMLKQQDTKAATDRLQQDTALETREPTSTLC